MVDTQRGAQHDFHTISMVTGVCRSTNNQSRDVSQISIKINDTIVDIKNKSKKIWFKYKFDLAEEKIINELHDLVIDKQNLLLYVVFHKLKEATKYKDKNHLYSKNIEAMRNEIRNIYDKLSQEHVFNSKNISDYEREIPEIHVSFDKDEFLISSEMFSDCFYVWDVPRPGYLTPIEASIEKIKCVELGIMANFTKFFGMIFCIICREIKLILIEKDKTFFKDPVLLKRKDELNEVISKPISKLRTWIAANKDIPGMYKVTGWDLKSDGKFTQIHITKLLKDNEVDVVGVENKPHDYGKNLTTNKQYDVDIEVEYEKSRIPVQVYVREGELSRKIRNSVKCFGEERVDVPGVIGKYGATNDNYGKVEDYCQIVGKLAKTPPNGVLLIISNTLPNNPGIIPLKEWWCNGILDDKCIIIKRGDRITIYSNPGFDTKNAKKLAQSLGDARPESETSSNFTLCGDFLTEAFSESQAGTS